MLGSAMVLAILVMLALGACAMAADDGRAARPKDFGKRWVRSHPFTIMSPVQHARTLDMQQYRAAGMTSLQVWKPKPAILGKATADGISWHCTGLRSRRRSKLPFDMLMTDREKARARRLQRTYPGGAGWFVWDEPRHPAFPTMADAMKWFRETFPDMLVYSNLYCAGGNHGKYYHSKVDPATGDYSKPPVPYTYEIYLQEYIDLCQPDLLMIDCYPFTKYENNDDVTAVSVRWFDTLETVRKVAMKADIPYWIFVQTFGYTRRWYVASESDLRMEVFSALAYGFTGISHFLYQDPSFPDAMLDGDGIPTRIFYEAAEVNREVLRIGRALRFLTSTDVRYVPGMGYRRGKSVRNDLPKGAKAFTPAAGKAYGIADIEVRGLSASRNGLVGFFRDDDGGRYFMLVNVRRARGVSAADMEATFILRFDPAVKKLTRLSRITGKVENVPLKDGTLTLTLPGGTGDLFKLPEPGNRRFPGL